MENQRLCLQGVDNSGEKTRVNTHKTTTGLQRAADRKGETWLFQVPVPQAVWEWRDQCGWEIRGKIPRRASAGTASSYGKANHRHFYLWSTLFQALEVIFIQPSNQSASLLPRKEGTFIVPRAQMRKQRHKKVKSLVTPFTMSMNFRVSG